MARRIPKHVFARLRSEGKLPTRSELSNQAEQSLRDAVAHRGHATPALMRSVYGRGVSVATIAKICGKQDRQVKEMIVEASSSKPSEPTEPLTEPAADEPQPEPQPDDAKQDGEGTEQNTDAPDLSNYSDGELVSQATSLRQAGNAQEAAHYDRELERREGDAS